MAVRNLPPIVVNTFTCLINIPHVADLLTPLGHHPRRPLFSLGILLLATSLAQALTEKRATHCSTSKT